MAAHPHRPHYREVVRPLLVQSLSCVEVGLAFVILDFPLSMWSVFPRVTLDWSLEEPDRALVLLSQFEYVQRGPVPAHGTKGPATFIDIRDCHRDSGGPTATKNSNPTFRG